MILSHLFQDSKQTDLMQFFEESFIEDDDSFIAESADVIDPPGDNSRDSAAFSVGVSGIYWDIFTSGIFK